MGVELLLAEARINFSNVAQKGRNGSKRKQRIIFNTGLVANYRIMHSKRKISYFLKKPFRLTMYVLRKCRNTLRYPIYVQYR